MSTYTRALIRASGGNKVAQNEKQKNPRVFVFQKYDKF